jgi:hypothetical protein
MAQYVFENRSAGVVKRMDIYGHLMDQCMSASKVYRHMGYLTELGLVSCYTDERLRCQMLYLHHFLTANDIDRLVQYDARRRVQSRVASRRLRQKKKEHSDRILNCEVGENIEEIQNRQRKNKQFLSSATCQDPSGQASTTPGVSAKQGVVTCVSAKAGHLAILDARDAVGQDPDFALRCKKPALPPPPPASRKDVGPLRALSAWEVDDLIAQSSPPPKYGSDQWIHEKVRSITRLKNVDVKVLLDENVQLPAINAAIDTVVSAPIGKFKSDAAIFIATARRYNSGEWGYPEARRFVRL